jgi:hypothetical protein
MRGGQRILLALKKHKIQHMDKREMKKWKEENLKRKKLKIV